jgi:limonene-1,2-epoxide hydrolase
MSPTPSNLVREFCNALTSGSMAPARVLLHDEVYYHNQPWQPMTGADAVCAFLQPFVDGTHCRCVEMNILHQAADGETVMNAREELWVRGELKVLLPVAGLFIVQQERITRWVDYWDLAAFQPMIDAVAGGGLRRRRHRIGGKR